jgi:hypothetical protein
MNPKQLSEVMQRCRENIKVRYVSPVIHARTWDITAFKIWTADEVVDFTITNNPDENFDLFKTVNEYLDKL